MIHCRSALSLTVIVVSLLCVVGVLQRPVTGSPSDTSTPQDRTAETAAAQAWAFAVQGGQAAEVPGNQNVLVAIPPSPPFSFVFGGQESTQLLGVWKRESGEVRESGARSLQSTTWTDPQTNLQVRADVTMFRDFPAVEWVLHFTNTGTADTPILERILPLDSNLQASRDKTADPVLHYAKGALCCLDDYAPVTEPLVRDKQIHLQPGGGRSSSEFLPFFNLDLAGQGVVWAVGWTGEWAVDVARRETAVQVRAGMANTHFTLHPGETVRTPSILTLFWQGERMRGNNLLRRFLLAHRRPHPNGTPLVLPVLTSGWGGTPVTEHLALIDRIAKHDLPIKLYWIDAEWFGAAPWFKHVGDWRVREELYPNGLRPIGDRLHETDRQFLLWFELHRVCKDTPWCDLSNRPGWLFELRHGTPQYQQQNCNWGIPHDDPRWIEYESRRTQIMPDDRLLNLGNDDVRRFLTDFVAERIEQYGLDWYREDFNIAPLEYWREADAPDRMGISEIRFITNLYAMWDELLGRFPHLAIDNCASGGRRIDLETIGRSTALWRTDWPVDATHRQCHSFGLLAWVPLNMSDGPVLARGNEYEIRSAMTAGLNIKLPGDDMPETVAEAKRLLDQYLQIQKYYYGDYYPLTDYSQSNDVWMAYQLDLPEIGEGIVVVLKRPGSRDTTRSLRLENIDPAKSYQISNLDSGQQETVTGSTLNQLGLRVQLQKQPDSAVLHYKTCE
jgi:alpha-galactosidase